jgi:hypothetical protein
LYWESACRSTTLHNHNDARVPSAVRFSLDCLSHADVAKRGIGVYDCANAMLICVSESHLLMLRWRPCCGLSRYVRPPKGKSFASIKNASKASAVLQRSSMVQSEPDLSMRSRSLAERGSIHCAGRRRKVRRRNHASTRRAHSPRPTRLERRWPPFVRQVGSARAATPGTLGFFRGSPSSADTR